MAGNKKPRKAVKPQSKRIAAHIISVLRVVLGKFHVIGDMNHLPTAFHFAELSQHLKGSDLRIAQDYAFDWLCIHKRAWTMVAMHYFKTEEGIEVIPTSLVIQDATLGIMGRDGEFLLKEMREALFKTNDAYNEDTLAFYGYYMTHGEDLNIASVEDQLSESFLKITQDLEKIQPHVVAITEEKTLMSLGKDKFSISNRNALTTKMVKKE